MNRREFLEWTALAGASVAATPAWARRRRRRYKPGDVRGPRYQAPKSPLTLPAWKYGAHSTALDTMLMFRGNGAHTFYGTGPIPSKLRVKWRHRQEDFPTMLRGKKKIWQGTGWTGHPAKLGNYVYVGSVGRNMYCYEAFTGKVAWRWRSSRMFKGSLCIYDNKIYAGNTDNRLHCFDAATGKHIWRFDTGRDLDSSPCVVDGKLYIAGESGYARCIDPQTGKQLWKTFVGGIGPGTKGGSNGSETSPAVVDGEYYTATYDGNLFCLDAKTGKRRWKAKTHGDTDASPVVSGEFVYAAAEEDAPYLYAFSRKTGKRIWRYAKNGAGYWSTPAVSNNRVYIGGDDGRMHCVDAKTGKNIWLYKTRAAIWSSPCVVDNQVIFGGIDNHLHVIDAKTGKLMQKVKTPGRIISTPCIVGGNIWVGTATGYFFCFGA